MSTRPQGKPDMSSRMSKIKVGGGMGLTSAERISVLNDLKKKDDETGKKTFSRMFVENYLSKYDWYWPRRLERDAPQLSAAWAYYEHNTLPRFITGDNDAEHVYRKAERGEFQEETELYPSCSLPQRAFIEWGAGMDLYFVSVLFFAFLMLICGCINILSIGHFMSYEYNADSLDIIESYFWVKGSAVCLNTQWVVCEDCRKEDWTTSPNKAPERFAEVDIGNNVIVNLVKRNLCKFEENNLGWPNFATLWVLLIMMGLFNLYLRAREVRFDEDKLTTTDYSLVVLNPPPDAKDPDEWQQFFTQFVGEGDQVTAVTVALDNQDLINRLANRRVARVKLAYKIGDHVDLDDDTAVRLAIDNHNQDLAEKPVGCIGRILKCIRPIVKLIGMMLTADELYDNITRWTEEIKELQEKKYNASKVYVTFETEHGQRTSLSALNVGTTDVKTNRLGDRPSNLLFRESLLLDTAQPAEPSAIRYTELAFSLPNRMTRRAINFSITVLLIAFCSWLITGVRNDSGAANAGYLTTFFNSTIPTVIKLLMMLERHEDEGGYQRSVYFKLTLFRWTLSGFLSSFIVPFTNNLGDDKTDLVPAIAGLLLSELWLTPLLKIADIMPNLYKHVLAPHANSQDEMNACFNGSWFQLGERYTDITKILFMIFYYSALFPAGFFFGFVILLTQYFLDKWALTRLWQPTPKLGADLATFSRKFFYTICMIAFAIISSFWWAQFPYDNLCEPVEPSSVATTEYSDVLDLNGNPITGQGVDDNGVVTVGANEFVYCNQNWRSWPGLPYPATPRVQNEDGNGGWFDSVDENAVVWMDESQSLFCQIYGWTSILVFFGLVFGLFTKSVYTYILSLFVGTYDPEGACQNIDFSSNVEIFGYVPEIKKGGQTFPFLCCDTDDYDENLIAWVENGSKDYDKHNLIFDVPHKSLRRQEPMYEDALFETPDMEGFHRNRYPERTMLPLDYENSIYSTIKHYPTKWQLESARKYGFNFDGEEIVAA